MLIRGTSTLRNLENYHKLMGKKQGTYLKSYGAFLKVGLTLPSTAVSQKLKLISQQNSQAS